MINDVNNEKRKESMIRGLGVFELRAVARQLGVPSPTTKKREDLIALILEASRNGKYIEENMPKRGRPFKRLNVLEHITNKISPDDFKGLDFESVIRFEQEVVPCVDEIDETVYNFEGIVRKNDIARMFDLATNEAIFLEDSIMYFDMIETGDYFYVEAIRLSGEENQFAASKILEINGENPEDYNASYQDLGKEIIANATIPFAESNIKLGRRNAFKLQEPIFENDNLERLHEYCSKNNYHLITIGVNISFENDIKLSSFLRRDNFTTVYGTNPDISYNKVIDAILYAYNLADKGENVMLFITDIVDIVRCLDLNFENDFDDEHAPKTKVVIQKLLAFAHSYENGNHETIVLCYEESDAQEKYLTNEILKLCNKL